LPEQKKKEEQPSAIVLEHRDLLVRVEPELGGAISRFRRGDWEVLRPSPPATNALEASCFAMAPYANRIRNGAFEFNGRKIALNHGGADHALHGDGWRTSWDVIEAHDARIVLTYRHEPDDWPWAYVCKQVVELSDWSLRMELSVRNVDRAPMPGGLGFHPRFQFSPGARLAAHLEGYWDVDRELLPTARREDWRLGDWARGDLVAQQCEVDNCFWGWDGRAFIEFPAKRARVEMMAAAPARMLHLYMPSDRARGFCVEPVTHAPDAFNMRETGDVTGLAVLAPGETLSSWMELRVVDV
jgi:aldose 1-epimerase